MTARLRRNGSRVFTLVLALSLTACLSWRVTLIGGPAPIDQPPTTIALAPGDGLFIDLIGFALAERGYAIVDTGMTLALLVILREHENDILAPPVLTAFRQRGIEAILTVHQAESPDHLPQRATAQLYGTHDAALMCHFEWQTGWRQRGPVEAAQEIAATVVKCLEGPSDNPILTGKPGVEGGQGEGG
jgi:hypothetical protein